MPMDQISPRQLRMLLFAALLSPAIQALPGHTAALAGRAAWLSVLPALPLFLLLCLVLRDLSRTVPGGEGMAGTVRAVLGRRAGTVVLVAYLLWGILLLGADARRYALRFLSTGYRNAPLPVFIAIMLLAAFWVGRGRLAVLARAGELVCLALAVALGLVLFFGLFQIRAANLLPVWTQDLPGIGAASFPVLAVLGYTTFGGFLHTSESTEKRGRWIKWGVAVCGVLLLLQVVCLGSFGPTLTVRMDAPFFMMVKGVGVQGAFERVESVIIALWVLSDLALLCLLLFACRSILDTILPTGKGSPWGVAAVAGIALLAALFLFPDGYILSDFMEGAAAWGSVFFGFLLPLLIWLIAKLRGRVKTFP